MDGLKRLPLIGWLTTSEHFEIAFNGQPNTDPYQYVENSPYGDYFIELNAETPDIYYQDLATNANDVLVWSFIHSTRNTVNVYSELQNMAVIIGKPETTPTKTVNVIDETTTEAIITDGIKNDEAKERWESSGLINKSKYGFAVADEVASLSLAKGSGWKEAKGVYKIPENQTMTRFGFLPLTQDAGGNFIDNVKITTILGNVKCKYNSSTDMYEITGYWEPSNGKNTNKDLVYHIRDSAGNEILSGKIEMSNITTNHFKVEFKKFMDEEITVDVYHEDYQN